MSRIKIDDKSMKECGLKNIDMWGGAPHYCRMDYNSSMEAALAFDTDRVFLNTGCHPGCEQVLEQ